MGLGERLVGDVVGGASAQQKKKNSDAESSDDEMLPKVQYLYVDAASLNTLSVVSREYGRQ